MSDKPKNKKKYSVSFRDFLKKDDRAEPEASQLKDGQPEPGRKEENHNLTVILASLAVALFVILLLMILLVTPGMRSILSGRGGSASDSRGSTSSLALLQKPKDGKAVLTTEQVSDMILPCVVGVVQYQQGSLTETGEGSGIIMSANGLIITNEHVIDGASKLEVVLRSGKRYQASVVGFDTRTDIAVVKITEKNMRYAQFGDSNQCRVGEKVIAVGNPSGLQLAGSVTQGIISALNRNVDVGNGPMNLIQTDAAINPGNSGGALVNMYGQVIGVNSAKIAQSGYEGLGFSIPIKTAKPVIDSILRYGYVKGRVKFGLSCKEMDSVTAQLNELPVGIYVEYVEPDSSAEKNGVLADDIITAIDGKSVKDTDSLIAERDKHKVGDEVILGIYRRSEKKSLLISLNLIEDRGAAKTEDKGDW